MITVADQPRPHIWKEGQEDGREETLGRLGLLSIWCLSDGGRGWRGFDFHVPLVPAGLARKRHHIALAPRCDDRAAGDTDPDRALRALPTD
jgi:hypothetical protein